MRPVIICANWKMNTTPAEAGPLARAIAAATDVADVKRVICPPYVALAAVLFLLFIPFLTGLPVPETLWAFRFPWGGGFWTWFSTWI